jgi:NTP pyrophosphatase (non-canonical NTP hydrolase)
MTQRVADLTTGELERLVENTVRRTIEEYVETLEALNSVSYLESIREAREDSQNGTVTNLADLRDE